MNNIERIQERLASAGLDALLITDEKDQRYALGFPFTDGAVVVSRRGAWLITDSRYIEAAEAAAGGFARVVQYDAAHPLTARVRAVTEAEGIARLGAEEDKLSHAAFLRWENAHVR